jgi:hypothetical protein
MVKRVTGFRGVAFAIGALFLAISPAQATLINNGSYTTDTVTGLDWLDLTSPLSLGKSFNTVTSLFATTLSGWHYASGAQVSKLFDDAGGVGPYGFSGLPPNGNGSAAQLTAVNLLIGLLGNTGSFGNGGLGITSDVAPSLSHWDAAYLNVAVGYLLVPQNWNNQTDTFADPALGSFLIRDTVRVPEPASLMLFATGLVGLAASRRRRKAEA